MKNKIKSHSPVLREDFICPVCLEILTPPIYQCYNGHLVCHECLPRLQDCPVCRTDFGETPIRNLIIERLGQAQVFPCRNISEGCPAYELKQDEFKSHSLDCSQEKQEFCKVLGVSPDCSILLRREELCEHIKRDHSQVTGVTSKRCEIIQEVPLELLAGAPSKIRLAPIYFKQFQQVFVIQSYLEGNEFTWEPRIASSSRLAQGYRVRLKICSFKKNPGHLQWEGNPVGMDGELDSSLTIPLAQLEKYGVVSKGNCCWMIDVRLEKVEPWELDYISKSSSSKDNPWQESRPNNLIPNEKDINPLRLFNGLIQSEVTTELILRSEVENSRSSASESEFREGGALEWNFQLIIYLVTVFTLFVR